MKSKRTCVRPHVSLEQARPVKGFPADLAREQVPFAALAPHLRLPSGQDVAAEDLRSGVILLPRLPAIGADVAEDVAAGMPQVERLVQCLRVRRVLQVLDNVSGGGGCLGAGDGRLALVRIAAEARRGARGRPRRRNHHPRQQGRRQVQRRV